MTGKKIIFKSKLENWAEGMDYCAISVPSKVTKSLGTTKAVLVLASLNGCEPFQVSLFPVGGGQHFIRVRAKVRKQAGLKEGDSVQVHITVLDRSKVDLPADLISALKAESALKDFLALSPGKKNYAVRKINEASRIETRKKRIDEAIELALKDAEAKIDRMKKK